MLKGGFRSASGSVEDKPMDATDVDKKKSGDVLSLFSVSITGVVRHHFSNIR